MMPVVAISFYFDQLSIFVILQEAMNEIVADVIPNSSITQLHGVTVLSL